MLNIMLLACMLTGGSWLIGNNNVCAALTPAELASQAPNDPALAQRQQQEMLDLLRQEEAIKEQMKPQEDIQKPDEEEQQQDETMHFLLKNVSIDESEVLTAQELDEVAREYIGQEVTIKDLLELIQKINNLYGAKAYLTCKAYLPPQTIHEGIVHIGLFEGRNGQLLISGNKHTDEEFIRERLVIPEGEITSLNSLNRQLRYFNKTNDIRIQIAMKAGQEPGTTDYELIVQEPQNQTWRFFGDNSGSVGTGKWREGAFYNIKSITGWRDSLTLGWIRSQGMDTFLTTFSIPVNKSGTRFELNYNTSGTHVVKGMMKDKGIDIEGHAYSLGGSIYQPLFADNNWKIESFLSVTRQHSVTDMGSLLKMNNDYYEDYVLGMTAVRFGRGWVWYQKHAYTWGKWDNESSYTSIGNPSRRYQLYNMNMVYQQAWQHGQLLSLRGSLQYSPNEDLNSSRKIYLGGAYTVRGYEQNILGSGNGYNASIEYSVPVTKDKQLSMYGFFDVGGFWGNGLFVPQTKYICSTGLGLRENIDQHVTVDVAMGVPLRRHIVNLFDATDKYMSKTFFHLMVNASF